MPARTRQPSEVPTTRPTSITAVVDCPGALASRSMEGNFYLYDTKKAEGSTGFGTEELRTPVKKGDELLWNVVVLECETYVAIDGIKVDPQVCVPERRQYPGTDILYWAGTVLKDVQDSVPYQISFRVGGLTTPIATTAAPALVG
jgi:hypothetical protein